MSNVDVGRIVKNKQKKKRFYPLLSNTIISLIDTYKPILATYFHPFIFTFSVYHKQKLYVKCRCFSIQKPSLHMQWGCH